MLEQEIIQSVENRSMFSKGELYRIYMDREDIADNLIRRWKDDVTNALEVSTNLVSKIEEVYQQAIVEEDDEKTMDVDAALKSTNYRGYLIAASELQKVNISELSVKERIAFFLNVY